MSRLRQALQRVFGVTPTPGALRARTIDTNFSIIKGNCVATPLLNVGLTKRAEGDRVIIHGKQPSLSKALKRGENLQTARGSVDHDSIIGKRVWDMVQSRKGQHTHFSMISGHDTDISIIYRPESPIQPPNVRRIRRPDSSLGHAGMRISHADQTRRYIGLTLPQ